MDFLPWQKRIWSSFLFFILPHVVILVLQTLRPPSREAFCLDTYSVVLLSGLCHNLQHQLCSFIYFSFPVFFFIFLKLIISFCCCFKIYLAMPGLMWGMNSQFQRVGFNHSSPTRIEPEAPALRALNPSHWTTSEVLIVSYCFICLMF